MITIREHDGEVQQYWLELDDRGVLWIKRWGKRRGLLVQLIQKLGWQVIDAEPDDRKLLEECGVWGGRVQ